MNRKYAYTINLMPYGGVSSAAIDNRAKAEFDMGAEYTYYQRTGRGIKSVTFSEFCATCGGDGRVTKCHSRVKFHSHKESCYRRCPDCKGKDSLIETNGLPSGSIIGSSAQMLMPSDSGFLAEYNA